MIQKIFQKKNYFPPYSKWKTGNFLIWIILTSPPPPWQANSDKGFFMYVLDFAFIQIILVSSSKITLELGFSLDSAASNSVLFTLFSHLFVLVFYIWREPLFVLHIPHFKKFSAPMWIFFLLKQFSFSVNSRLMWTRYIFISYLPTLLYHRDHIFLHPVRDAQEFSNVAFCSS